MTNQINLADLHQYVNILFGSMSPLPNSPYSFNYKGNNVIVTFDRLSDISWRNVKFSF